MKTELNGSLKVECLVNTVDKWELPSYAVTVLAWSSKKHAVSCYPDGRLCIFCWLIPDTFHPGLLSFGLLGAVLVGINHLVFWKELIIEDFLPNPAYIQYHLLWMKTALWCGC